MRSNTIHNTSVCAEISRPLKLLKILKLDILLTHLMFNLTSTVLFSFKLIKLLCACSSYIF